MKHICYFEVPADNLERARHFYNKLFGWEFSEMSMGHAPYFTIKTPDGISGGLMSRKDKSQGITNYIEVGSISDYVNKAKTLGGKVVVDRTTLPGMGHFALIQDPENNVVGLWQIDPQAH
ncbi:MAG: hypothetical protein A2Z86_09795 [Candidatus Glassbacteria bacterium GWA2_58_10]|uniref:VOC domain-containing protein n=1 Tax=Candidatus Glassbacteria bacterium GWA2_58_10 TaxID=1817865 RepID=A0A1F5YEF5_9BACT|nr:MAG: hypothetical protein A2Z86_09795 [Candidatus Glassbacteria bacterium GWA2_58_10]